MGTLNWVSRLCCLLMLIELSLVAGNTRLAVKFLTYDNPSRRQFDGTCCDPVTGSATCSNSCDYTIVACIDDSIDNSCPTGKHTLTLRPGVTSDTFTFPDLNDLTPNPYIFRQIEGRWKGSVSLKFVVEDRDVGDNAIVDVFRTTFSTPAASSTRALALATAQPLTLTGTRKTTPSTLSVGVSVFCDSNYYGPQCRVFCKMTRSCEGHYTCDASTGQKLCMSGWTGSQCNLREFGEEATCPATAGPLPLPPQDVCEQVDVVFLLDVSDSQSVGNSWSASLDFIVDLISLLNVGTGYAQVGLVTFGQQGTREFHLNRFTDAQSLTDVIINLAPREGEATNIGAGLESVAGAFQESFGNRLGVRDVVIAVTAGKKHDAGDFGALTASKLTALKDGGNDVFAVLFNGAFADTADSGYAEWLQVVSSEDYLYEVPDPTAQSAYDLAQRVKKGAYDACEEGGFGAAVAATVDTINAAGRWNGSLTCKGDVYPHSLALSVDPRSPDTLRGEYVWRKPDGTRYVEAVSVKLGTAANPTTFSLAPSMWLERPKPHGLVSLSGIYEENPERFTGTVTSTECNSDDPFRLEKYTPPQGACDNGGTCVRFGNGDDQYYCCCQSGFTGEFCEKQIDLCEANPCQVGECSSDGVRYECSCPLGFSGVNCQIVGTPVTCGDDPCENEVACLSSAQTGYVCQCKEGFTGFNCEAMEEVPCLENYYGDDCTVFCEPRDDCTGHYTCSDTGVKQCLSGWGTPTADCVTRVTFDSGECPGNVPCMNGGTCFSDTCCCAPGYEGVQCGDEIDVCASNPCKNGGSCTHPRPDFYECDCPQEFSGYNCDFATGSTSTSTTTSKSPNTTPRDTTSSPAPGGDTTPREATTKVSTASTSTTASTSAKTALPAGTTPREATVSTAQPTGTPREGTTTTTVATSTTSAATSSTSTTTTAATAGVTTPRETTSTTTTTRTTTTTTTTTASPKVSTPRETTSTSATSSTSTTTPSTTTPFRTPQTDTTPRETTPTTSTTTTSTTTTAPTSEPSSFATTPTTTPFNTPKTDSTTVAPTTPRETTSTTTSTTTSATTSSTASTSTSTTTTKAPSNTTPREGCQATDDCEGHFVCNAAGKRVCAQNWKGSSCLRKTIKKADDPDCPAAGCVSGDCWNEACCCYLGFEGEKCDVNINDCLADPCKNNATCVDKVNDYSCTCPTGFGGKNCDVLAEPCNNAVCNKNGKCLKMNNFKQCICDAGFFGPTCAESVTTLAPPTTTANLLDAFINLLGDYEDVDIDVTQQLIAAILPILINAGLLSSGGANAGVQANFGAGVLENHDEDVTGGIDIQIQLGDLSITFTFNMSGSELSYTTDGSEFTRIPFTYTAINVVTGEEVAIENSVLNSIASVLYDPVKKSINTIETTGSRPFSTHLSLVLKNEHLDRAMFATYERVMRPLFLEANPEYANLNGFFVDFVRSDEALAKMPDGSLFGSATILYYWLVHMEGDVEIEIDPATINMPSDEQIVQVLAEAGVTVEIYTGEVVSLVSSFGVFVNGPVFEEDAASWTELLQTYWRNDPKHAQDTVIVGHSELYYTTFGQVTRLFYFLLNVDGNVIKSSTYGLTPPKESALQTQIAFENTDGSTVTLFTLEDIEETPLDHTSISSPSLMRAREAFEIYATVIFSRTNFVAIKAVLQLQFETVFSGATLTVMAAEDCFSPTFGASFGALRFFVQNEKGGMVDARRYRSISPTLPALSIALSNIRLPSGEAYQFITDRAELGSVQVLRSEAFFQIFVGALPEQNYALVTGALRQALADSGDAELDIQVLANEECIGMDGEGVSVLFLTMLEVRGGLTRTLSVRTRDRLNIRLSVLQPLLDALPLTRPLKLRPQADFVNLRRVSNMFVFYSRVTFLGADVEVIFGKLLAFISGKVSRDVVLAPFRMEECLDSSGNSLTCLYFIIQLDGATIPRTELTLDLQDLPPIQSSVCGASEIPVLTEPADVQGNVRASQLFEVMLQTSVASSSEADLEVALAGLIASSLGVAGNNILVRIMAMDEFVTEDEASVTRILYAVKQQVDGKLVDLNPRTTMSPAADDLFAAVETVRNGGGAPLKPFTEQEPKLSRVKDTRQLAINRQLVRTDVKAAERKLAEVVANQLQQGAEGSSSVVQAADVSVSIIRGLDCIVMETASPVVVLEISVEIAGAVLSPDLCGDLDVGAAVASFPAMPLGVPYQAVEVDLADLFDLSKCFSFFLEEDVDKADWAKLAEAAVEALRLTNPGLPFSIDVKVARVREVFDTTNQDFVYEVCLAVYADGDFLDGSVEASISLPRLQATISERRLAGPRGVYTVVEDRAIEIVTPDAIDLLLVQQKVKLSHVQVIEAILSNLTSLEVSVIHKESLLSLNGYHMDGLMYVARDLTSGGLVPNDRRPALSLAAIQEALDAASSSSSSLLNNERYMLLDEPALSLDSVLRVPLSAPVLIQDMGAVEVQLGNIVSAQTAAARACSSNVKAKILMQERSFVGRQLVYVALVLLTCEDDGEPLLYDRALSEVTYSDVRNAMDAVPISGGAVATGGTYRERVVNEVVQGAVPEFETIRILLDGLIHENQRADLEYLLKLAYTELNADLSRYTVTMVHMNTIYTSEGTMYYAAHFVVRDGSNGDVVCTIDLPALLPARLTFLMSSEQLAVVQRQSGAPIHALEEDAAVKHVPEECVMTAAIWSDTISSGDVTLVENALVLLLDDILKDVTGRDYDTRVHILQTTEMAWYQNPLENQFGVQILIEYNRQPFCANLLAPITADQATSALSKVQRTGTDMTYGDIVLSVPPSQLAPYSHLFHFIVNDLVVRADFAMLEALLYDYVVEMYSLQGGVTVRVWKEEYVENAGETQVVLSFGVLINGNLIDARVYPRLDIASLRTLVASSELAARVTVVSGVEDGERFDNAQKVCFFNEVSEEDYETLRTLLTEMYGQMQGSFKDVQLTFLKVDILSSATSEQHYCVYYLPMLTGAVLQQAADINTLIVILQTRGSLSALGEEFLVTAETPGNLFQYDSYAYVFCLTRYVLTVDIERVLASLQNAWIQARPDLEGINLTFLRQMEAYSMDGNMAVCGLYRVNTAAFTLSAQIEAGLDDNAFNTALRSVQVTGRPQGETYAVHIYTGSWVGLVLRRELCTLVLEQKVSKPAFGRLGTLIAQAWRDDGVEDIDVTIITQREVMIGHRFTGFAVLYLPTDYPDDNILTCRNFRPSFYEAVTARVGELRTMAGEGEPFKTLPIEQAIGHIDKSLAFSLYLNEAVRRNDEVALKAAIEQQWMEQYNEVAQVRLSVLDEYVTAAGMPVWNIRYFVTGTGAVIVDPRLRLGLSGSDLLARLTSVALTPNDREVRSGGPENYAGLVYRGDAMELLPYAERFVLTLEQDVARADLPNFVAAIVAAWAAGKPDFATSDLAVQVIKTEAVIANQQFYYQVVYFVRQRGQLLDSRCEAPVPLADLATAVTQAQISISLIGPDAMYELAANVNPMEVRRAAFSLRLFLQGPVSASKHDTFQGVLKDVWAQVLPQTDVELSITAPYVFEGRRIVACLYFLKSSVDGHLIIPGTLVAPPLQTFQARLLFEQLLPPAYRLLPASPSMLPYGHHLSLHLLKPVLQANKQAVFEALRQQWQQFRPDLSSLEVLEGLQEEMVWKGRSVWQFSYFLRAGDMLLNGHQLSDLPVGNKQQVLSLERPGSGGSYSSLLITASMMDLIPIEDLFIVLLRQKVAIGQLKDAEDKIAAAWTSETGMPKTVHIAMQDRYVTPDGGLIWGIYYQVMENDLLVRPSEQAPLPPNLLRSALEDLTNLRGERNEVYSMNTMSGAPAPMRYVLAQYSVLRTAVQIKDVAEIMSRLTTSWRQVSGVEVTLRMGVQEEHLTPDGSSVYKFSYFAMDPAGKVLNALFMEKLPQPMEDNVFSLTVSGTSMQYKDSLYRADLNVLTPFSRLLGLPMLQRVAAKNYPQIAAVLRASWSEILDDVRCEIRAQEEYLDPNTNAFYPVLLYSAMVGEDVELWPGDLPKLDIELDVEITSPLGKPYEIASRALEDLRRVRLARHVFLRRYVERGDLRRVLEVVGTRHRAFSAIPQLTATYGAAEWHITSDGERIVKLLYFLERGDTILDANLERMLSVDDLTNLLSTEGLSRYEVLSTGAMPAAHSTRISMVLTVQGVVAKEHVQKLEDALTGVWAQVNPGLKAKVKFVEEFVGNRGDHLTGLVYFLMNGDEVMDPSTLPSPSNQAISNGVGNVLSPVGFPYDAYMGSALPYHVLYSLSVRGEVSSDTAQRMVDSLASLWSTVITNVVGAEEPVPVALNVIKLEHALGDFGLRVTRVLYSLEVYDALTFPMQDPPNMPAIYAQLARVPDLPAAYTADDAVSLDQHWSMQIQGPVSKAMNQELAQSLKESYEFLEPFVRDHLSFMMAGYEMHVDQATRLTFTTIYYRAMLHNELVTAAVIPPPSLDLLAIQISSRLIGVSLVSFASPTARMRPLLLSGPVAAEQVRALETVLQGAWSSVQMYQSVVTVVYEGQERYATNDWTIVSNVHYAVFVNDSNPEDLGAMLPSEGQLDQALDQTEGLVGTCGGCEALPVRTLYLVGELSSRQRGGLQQTLLSAWIASNLDLESADFQISVRPENVRRLVKRQIAPQNMNPGWYENEQGDMLTPVDYTVSFRDAMANPLFVAPPSDARLNSYLDTGVQTSTCGCSPISCYKLRVQGEVEDSTPIVEAIRAAYAMANPDVPREEIDVYIKYVNSQFSDSEGNAVSEVAYCVRRKPEGADPLMPPSMDSLAEELDNQGHTMVPLDEDLYDNSSATPELWVIIVIVVSAVIALSLVLCAVCIVITRRRNFAQQQRSKRTSRGGATVTTMKGGAVPYKDEEDFAGHAIMYGNGSIFGGGSIGSKTALYDTQRHYYNVYNT